MFGDCVNEQVESRGRSVVGIDLDLDDKPRVNIKECEYYEFPANETYTWMIFKEGHGA